MFAIIDWEDYSTTIIKLSIIEEPRKPVNDYEVNERIYSRCPGFPGKFWGTVRKIGDSRADLNKELANVPYAHVTLSESNQNIGRSSQKRKLTEESVKPKNVAALVPKKKVAKDPVKPKTTESSVATKKVAKDLFESSHKDLAQELLRKERSQSSQLLSAVSSSFNIPSTKSPTLDVSPTTPSISLTSVDVQADQSTEEGNYMSELHVPFMPLKEKLTERTQCNCVKEIAELKEDVRKLRRRVRELEKSAKSEPLSPPPPPPVHQAPPPTVQSTASSPPPPPASLPVSPSPMLGSELYNGHTLAQLKDTVAHMDTLFECCHALLLKLFTADYIIAHSVTGQRANSNTDPKPKFDSRLFGTLTSIVKEKFPKASKPDITAKIQAVQKKYKLKQGSIA